MCYSAQVHAVFRLYVRQFGATIDLKTFAEIYERRRVDSAIKIPKALDQAFSEPETAMEHQIKTLIAGHNANEETRLQSELFTQKKRLVEAERKLQTKQTKAALESQRIATNKIEWATRRLEDLKRIELKDRDSRIFPGWWVPVMVMDKGQLVVYPMRYQCRPAGKPAFYDTKYPGTYNARKSNLEGFWKNQFGHTHGIICINAFYENVDRHRVEGRALIEGEKPENVILEFKPQPTQDMYIACVWSRWTAVGESDLLSFAAITDEPPAEVAAAGHDRCIIPLKESNIESWLNPNPKDLAAQYAILDDRERPYYEHHRMAA